MGTRPWGYLYYWKIYTNPLSPVRSFDHDQRITDVLGVKYSDTVVWICKPNWPALIGGTEHITQHNAYHARTRLRVVQSIAIYRPRDSVSRIGGNISGRIQYICRFCTSNGLQDRVTEHMRIEISCSVLQPPRWLFLPQPHPHCSWGPFAHKHLFYLFARLPQ